MDLKVLIRKKGITQIELSKMLRVDAPTLSNQVNKHKLLPQRALDRFCDFLEISKDDLVKSMNQEGSENE